MTVRTSRRQPAGVLVGLLAAGAVALAGCSGGSGGSGSGTAAGTSADSGDQGGAASSAAPAGGSSSSGGDPVSCSGTSCSLTLTGDATTLSVLGTQVRFGGVQDGRASLTVAGRSVSCRQGESVAAGPLRLTCTTVTADRVTLTAGLGG